MMIATGLRSARVCRHRWGTDRKWAVCPTCEETNFAFAWPRRGRRSRRERRTAPFTRIDEAVLVSADGCGPREGVGARIGRRSPPA